MARRNEGSAPALYNVTHNGQRYAYTGRIGTRIATGEATYEYQDYEGTTEQRLWATADGRITEVA